MQLKGATQLNLLITPNRADEPTITIDNLNVAQFIYLLLNNKEIREVIDTITSKVVLILGRFTNERKKVLDAVKSLFLVKQKATTGSFIAAIKHHHGFLDVCMPAQESFLRYSCCAAIRA